MVLRSDHVRHVRLLHLQEPAHPNQPTSMGTHAEERMPSAIHYSEPFCSLSNHHDFVVGAVRVELTTSSLSEMRSNQLSYAPEHR